MPKSSDAAPLAAPRLHFIDGLRGVAMLMVLAFHCWLHGGAWRLDVPLGERHHLNMAAPLGLGYTGVHLFLVLSGFCLYWPFVKGGGRREPTLWEYAEKRCRRILPPYYVTLAIFGGLALAQALYRHSTPGIGFALNWLGLHALMLHNTQPAYIASVDPPLWSLALEFQLYILFPVLVEALRRFSAARVLLLVLAFSAGFRAVAVHALPGAALWMQGVFLDSVFSRCFEFALGMFAAAFVAQWHVQGKVPTSRNTALLVAGGVLALMALDGCVFHLGIVSDAKWGVLYAILVVAASRPDGVLHRALSARWIVTLGVFSYSVYLIHEPLVVALSGWATRRHVIGPAMAAFDLALLLPLMLGLGYVFHRLFERPFMSPPDTRRARAFPPVSPTRTAEVMGGKA
ncbi:MAG: acyltransferase [Armatimonadetes bacterium]|nr:acyltransferase [Armatimonadota bacterium]